LGGNKKIGVKMNNVAFIYSQDFKKLDFGYGHPMRGDRYEKALEEFKRMDLLENLIFKEPVLGSENIIRLFQTPEYIKKVKKVSETGEGFYGEEVPAIKGIYDIILLSVSASITAINYLLDENQYNVAINICGGWHHAFENKGRGFCIFNDIAITANYLLKEKDIKRIMIIDYDAHHGDGTQRAFYNSSKVYTISFHQDPATLYPFRSGYEDETGIDEGKGFNKNFPLSDYCNDTEFVSKFNQISELINDFLPEIIILQMGVDGSKECAISSMQLTMDSYDYASKLLMDLQKKHEFKILALGGGGFVHPMLGQNWGIQIKNFMEKSE
jgi:acetoin utilization protein AcuC